MSEAPKGYTRKAKVLIKNKAKRKKAQPVDNPYFLYMKGATGKQTKSMRRYRRSIKERMFRERIKN